MIKRTITLELSGDTEADLEDALAKALRRIADGNTSGADSNDSGSFMFNVEEICA